MSAFVLQLVEGIQIVPRQTRYHGKPGTKVNQRPVDFQEQLQEHLLGYFNTSRSTECDSHKEVTIEWLYIVIL